VSHVIPSEKIQLLEFGLFQVALLVVFVVWRFVKKEIKK